ncbi:MAG: nucleotide exchange factor GrpE [Ruminococcus sp.]|nr:nucleotide exchange factor GrpE [Ruminococcus sp.]
MEEEIKEESAADESENAESPENTEISEEEGSEKEEKEEKAEDTAQEECEKLKKEIEDYKDKYLRLMAEYDNFRKRSAKERLELAASIKGDTISEVLPVMDNFERALGTETEDTAYKTGVEMIFKQFSDVMTKLGVEIIDPIGQVFDPSIANAVNQIVDPELGDNVVAQVFQKGYKIGGKIVRYAMVVVANT